MKWYNYFHVLLWSHQKDLKARKSFLITTNAHLLFLIVENVFTSQKTSLSHKQKTLPKAIANRNYITANNIISLIWGVNIIKKTDSLI